MEIGDDCLGRRTHHGPDGIHSPCDGFHLDAHGSQHIFHGHPAFHDGIKGRSNSSRHRYEGSCRRDRRHEGGSHQGHFRHQEPDGRDGKAGQCGNNQNNAGLEFRRDGGKQCLRKAGRLDRCGKVGQYIPQGLEEPRQIQGFCNLEPYLGRGLFQPVHEGGPGAADGLALLIHHAAKGLFHAAD